VAGKVADTEEHAAGVLEGIVAERPERAEHLRAMAEQARALAGAPARCQPRPQAALTPG